MSIISNIFIIIFLIGILFIFYDLKEVYKNKRYTTIDYQKIQKILDDIIDEEFAKYKLLTIEFQEDPYISEEQHKDMIIEVTSAVYSRIKNSKLIRTNLGLIYNIKNKDSFIKIISSRVSIYSIPYVKETNKVE